MRNIILIGVVVLSFCMSAVCFARVATNPIYVNGGKNGAVCPLTPVQLLYYAKKGCMRADSGALSLYTVAQCDDLIVFHNHKNCPTFSK